MKTIIISIIFLLTTAVNCLPNSYYSLHEESVIISYKDNLGNINQESRQGFLNMYNINDNKISCKSTLPCDDEIVSFPTIILGSPGIAPPSSKKAKFRVFIPEGAIEIKLTIFCTQSSLLGSVIRYNLIPDSTQTTKNFNDIMFSKEDSFTFSTFMVNDVYLQNAGGHINVYSRALLPPDSGGKNPPWENGGWLYINNFNQDWAIGQIQFGMKVHKTTFQSWYNDYVNKVKNSSKNDIYGLLSGSTIVPDPIIDPVNEYERGFYDGIEYCKNNSITCGTIKIHDNYDVDLNYVETIPGFPGGPWHIKLLFNGGVWELGEVKGN